MYKKFLKKYISKSDVNIYKVFWQFSMSNAIIIVVDDNDKFVGIIGKDDFRKAWSSPNIDKMTAIDICNRNCTRIFDDQDVYAMGRNVFADFAFNNIPIITRDGDVIDVFTRERAFYRQLYVEEKLPRMHYATQIWGAAYEAKKLGYDAISVIEFGVAGGNGLINCEFHAKEIMRILNIGIDVYGFDNACGLPESSDGCKDMVHLWPNGLFQMDKALLEDRLQFAKLVIGDIKHTADIFCDEYNPAPIGTILIDVDYYSSTVPVLGMLEKDDRFFLPRIYMFFDDVGAFYEFSGENLAIKEFNLRHEFLKISPESVALEGVGGWVDGFEGWSGWAAPTKRVKMCHRFKHPRYTQSLYNASKDKSIQDVWTTTLR